jgi:hypothetical protein
VDTKDFAWDDELLDDDSGVPVVYTQQDIINCIEAIFNFVANDINLLQYDPDPTRQSFVLTLNCSIDSLLAYRNDKTYSLESRLQLFDELKDCFIKAQNESVLHRFNVVVNRLIPPSGVSYLNVTELVLDDNGISLIDERERDTLSVEVRVAFKPISLMPKGLIVTS